MTGSHDLAPEHQQQHQPHQHQHQHSEEYRP